MCDPIWQVTPMTCSCKMVDFYSLKLTSLSVRLTGALLSQWLVHDLAMLNCRRQSTSFISRWCISIWTDCVSLTSCCHSTTSVSPYAFMSTTTLSCRSSCLSTVPSVLLSYMIMSDLLRMSYFGYQSQELEGSMQSLVHALVNCDIVMQWTSWS